MRTYRNYSDDDIINKSKEVKSLSALLKKLNLRPTGGNYVNMYKNLQLLKVDTSHWVGKAWNKDKQLKDWSQYTKNNRLKGHLIKKLGNTCQSCGLDKWMNQPIKLELHHMDGCRANNEEANLQLLCPNCHSYTNNYRKPH